MGDERLSMASIEGVIGLGTIPAAMGFSRRVGRLLIVLAPRGSGRPSMKKIGVTHESFRSITCTPVHDRERLLEPRLATYSTGNGGEGVVGVPPDQAYSADHQYQDDGEHDGIFSDILSMIVGTNLAKELHHRYSESEEQNFRGTCVGK